MKYNKTGKFTKKQRTLIQEISVKIKKLRDSGCYLISNCEILKAYNKKDIEHGGNKDLLVYIDKEHPIPFINIGEIDDSSNEEIEYFRKGYIDD